MSSSPRQIVEQRLKEAANGGPLAVFKVWLDNGGDLWNPVFPELFALALQHAFSEVDYDVLYELGEVIAGEWHGFNVEDLEKWISYLNATPDNLQKSAREIFDSYEKSKRGFIPRILPPGDNNE